MKRVIIASLAIVGLAVLMGVLTSLFLSHDARSLSKVVSIENACRCETAKGDAFDPGFKIEVGGLAGKCIDSCEYRPPVLIEKQNGKTHMANVFHEDHFWKLNLDESSVSSAELLLEQFAPLIYHTAFIFRLKAGRKALLQSQLPGGKTRYVDSFVFSPEAFPARGEKYTLWDGFWPNYPIAMRIYSNDKFMELMKQKRHPITYLPLNLNQQELKKLVALSIDFGTSRSLRSIYQLVMNNCATSVLDLAMMAKGQEPVTGNMLKQLTSPLRGIPLTIYFGTRPNFYNLGLVSTSAQATQIVNF
jgi:hypothetical protein